MKSGISGSYRHKIILYYTLAVVLPGFFLGYLAYRGIRNDQALREKESRRKLELTSREFFAVIDSGIVQYMKGHSVDSILVLSGNSSHGLLAWFVRETGDSVRLISHKLLYLPDESLNGRPGRSDLSASQDEGIRLEFTELKFEEALRFYQEKMAETNNPPEKIRAMVASARLLNKLNRPDRAKALYEEIRNRYHGNLMNGQIPVGLMACLEILKIERMTGNSNDFRQTGRQCLELMLHPSCEYGESQFGMFYSSFKEIIRVNDSVTDSLFKELDRQKERTGFLIRLINGQDLLAANNKLKEIGNGVSCIPVNAADLTALYLSYTDDKEVQTRMVVDFPVFLESISEKLLNVPDPDSSMNIRIENAAGNPVFSRIVRNEAGYLSFPFTEIFPGWKILLSENRAGFTASLLKAGSGIYLYFFILIALLMVLGFVFTIYMLNSELRLNRLKSEFISNVSHELKSPLTSIRMMTEMLHQKRVSTDEQKSDYYAAMLAENERLSHLIDNILDFSRLDDERKKYDFTELNLDELLRNYLESIRQRMPEPDFEIRYNCPDRVPVIRADRDAMLQVIYNLVDNAIKFSGKSKQIDIDLLPQIGELRLSVRDYGIGITAKDQEKIFDRFYRGDEAQRKRITGSGIGLTIVKKIIEAHNGTITLKSEAGKGSTFTVSIPVKGT